ncbi:hypothetical protein P3T76_013626 [Phytophthora citrophthora]|uniref:Uncharacterized protein n=1 Tax=Phytophthora citrophthora TaxID=4793 RepID=A0AAD9G2Z3_9STRA|nr:hypothetical protein P3T76_013626 [Phytophthora citrophthora]
MTWLAHVAIGVYSTPRSEVHFQPLTVILTVRVTSGVATCSCNPVTAEVASVPLPVIPSNETNSKETAKLMFKAKRKKFSKHNDLLLLRQVQTDHSFASGRGGLMDTWMATARKVKSVQEFTKKELTGKSAQARFKVLLENYRSSDRGSARASGVSEEYTAQQLLDELVVAVDEHAREEAERQCNVEGVLKKSTLPQHCTVISTAFHGPPQMKAKDIRRSYTLVI